MRVNISLDQGRIDRPAEGRERACNSHPAYVDSEMPAVTENGTSLWLFHWSKRMMTSSTELDKLTQDSEATRAKKTDKLNGHQMRPRPRICY
jgi:hypothetical protein